MKVFLLFIVALFLGYKFPTSKKAALGIAFILWILYALNNLTPDYRNYQYIYETFAANLNENGSFVFGSSTEPGWAFVMLIPALLNLPFFGFKLYIATVFILILYKTVEQFTENIALSLAAFTVFPFIHSVGAMRFGFAAILFFFFAAPLAKGERNKKAILMFIFGTLFAGSIHYSILILSFLIFAAINFDKKIIVALIAIIAVLTVLLRTDIPYNVFMSINLPHMPSLAENWLTHKSSPGRLSLGMFAISYFLDFYIAFMSSKICPDSPFSTFVKRMYILSIAFIPFVLITDQFTRLYYVMFPFNICTAANTLNVLKCRKDEGNIIKRTVSSPYITIAFVAAVKLFFTDFVYIGTYNEAFTYMCNNYLFDLL